MSFNLVDLIKDQINGQVIGQISNAVGESPEATKSVIESAIPAVLGGLMSKTSSDDDAGSVLDAVRKQDDSVLDNFAGLVASTKKDALVESGKHTVGSLLGGESAVGLVSAISSATSVDQSKTNSIVGMITPVVMSTVKRFMAGGGEVSQAGLTNMLLSQKDNIASALPSALTEKLNTSGLLGSLGSLASEAGSAEEAATAAMNDLAVSATGAVNNAVDNVTEQANDLAGSVTGAVDDAKNVAGDLADSAKGAVTGAADSVVEAAGSATDTVAEATSGSSWIKKLIPIIILAVLALFGYKYFAGAAMEQTTDSGEAPMTEAVAPELPDAPVTPVTDVVADAGADAVDTSKSLADSATAGVTGAISGLSGVVAGGGDVTNQLKGLFDTAQTSLGSITDVESAETALPVLTDFSGKLDGITAMADKLPEAAKPVFNSVVQGGLGQLNPMLDRAMAIPGVGTVLGGVIEPLKEKLAGLAGE